MVRERNIYYKIAIKGENDDYDSVICWILGGLPSSRRRRRDEGRGDGRE